MRTQAQVLAGLALLGACDALGPGRRDDGEVTLTICGTPTWVALQNEGALWTMLPLGSAPVDPTLSFRATERVGLTIADEPNYTTYFLTRAELRQASCLPFAVEKDPRPTSVVGVGSGHEFQVHTRHSAFRSGAKDSSFSLFIKSGGADVFAMLFERVSATYRVPRRMIVRRNVASAGDQTVALDFEAVDAVAFDSATLKLAGADPGPASVYSRFHAPGIVATVSFGNTQPYYYGLNSASLSEKEFMELGASSSSRSISFAYRRPRDTTLAFGPNLSQPSSSNVVADTCVQPSVSLPLQAEYPSFARAQFDVGFRSYTVLVSQGYKGTPGSAWELTIPDVRFNGGCMVKHDPSVTWTYEAWAYGGRFALFTATTPRLDGEMLRSAYVRGSGPAP